MNQFVTEKPLPRMRTIRETAEELGLHEYFIRTLVRQNRIKFITAGRKTLINIDRFVEFLNGEVSQ